MAKPRTPKGRARLVLDRLAEEYPGSAKELCALVHDGPFQLLVATILSAQTTDERVNMVTPEVFRRWPTPADLAAADPAELEAVIRSTAGRRPSWCAASPSTCRACRSTPMWAASPAGWG
jgi:endonuclease-3